STNSVLSRPWRKFIQKPSEKSRRLAVLKPDHLIAYCCARGRAAEAWRRRRLKRECRAALKRSSGALNAAPCRIGGDWRDYEAVHDRRQHLARVHVASCRTN